MYVRGIALCIGEFEIREYMYIDEYYQKISCIYNIGDACGAIQGASDDAKVSAGDTTAPHLPHLRPLASSGRTGWNHGLEGQ
jgi:hypothetical protein